MLLLDGVYVEEGERLCRYIARPAVATQRLSLTAQRQVRYQLKTPYRDGATHVLFEPVDCMAHLPVRHPSGDLRSCQSALLPIGHRPAGGAGAETAGESHPLSRGVTPGILPSALRASLRLFKIAPGDLVAPNSHARAQVTPAKRGQRASLPPEKEPRTEAERRGAMTWAQRLRRVCMRYLPVPHPCRGSLRLCDSAILPNRPHRHRDLQRVRWGGAGDCEHRGPGGDREDPRAPERELPAERPRAAARAAGAAGERVVSASRAGARSERRDWGRRTLARERGGQGGLAGPGLREGEKRARRSAMGGQRSAPSLSRGPRAGWKRGRQRAGSCREVLCRSYTFSPPPSAA